MNSENDDDEPFSQLTVAAETYRKNHTQYVRIQVEHEHPHGTNFHNVTVVGYSQEGGLVFRRDLGDSTGPPSARLQKWITVQPAKFPHVIAVTADESPCTDGLTFEMIRWNGTDEQKRVATPDNDPYPWEEFERQCDEELPPERLLLETTSTPADRSE